MECPECKQIMNQLCMYGTDEEINIEYRCDNYGTLARLTWNPGKRNKREPLPDEISF